MVPVTVPIYNRDYEKEGKSGHDISVKQAYAMLRWKKGEG